jgi:hypothetical protein
MSALNVQGIDLSKLEKIISVEDVDIKCCKCFPSSKCCVRIQLCLQIKEKTHSFLKQISGKSEPMKD